MWSLQHPVGGAAGGWGTLFYQAARRRRSWAKRDDGLSQRRFTIVKVQQTNTAQQQSQAACKLCMDRLVQSVQQGSTAASNCAHRCSRVEPSTRYRFPTRRPPPSYQKVVPILHALPSFELFQGLFTMNCRRSGMTGEQSACDSHARPLKPTHTAAQRLPLTASHCACRQRQKLCGRKISKRDQYHPKNCPSSSRQPATRIKRAQQPAKGRRRAARRPSTAVGLDARRAVLQHAHSNGSGLT